MKIEKDCFHCRVVMIGNTEVGKTSIMNRLILGTFNSGEGATVGANYQLYIQEVNQHKIEIQIWDTAGQERYRGMTPMYFRGAHAAIIMYSLTDSDSFASIDTWVGSLRDNADPNIIMFLVGNKQDLAAEARVVTTASGEAKAAEIKAEFAEVSAKTGYGVDDLFMNITRKYVEQTPDIEPVEDQTVDLRKAKQKKDGKKCC